MSHLYFRQLRAGHDFARADPFAAQMQNFSYAVGDREAGVAFLVDPAWGPLELVELLDADGMRLGGVLCTHGHPDHVGGTFSGLRIQGLRELLGHVRCPIHAHEDEIPLLLASTRLDGPTLADALVPYADGDTVPLGPAGDGGVAAEVLHTPGHTPGSVCLRVEQHLLTGDTLFVQGCGRVDLPGGDGPTLFRSLQRLAALPDDLVVYPGHDYGGASAPLRRVKALNPYLRTRDMGAWLAEREG